MAGTIDLGFLFRIGVSCEMGLRRSNNEDNFYADGQFKELNLADIPASLGVVSHTRAVIAVCDGMGGEDRGEYASWQAVKALAEYAPEIRKADAPDQVAQTYIRKANALICDAAARSGCRMGATLAMAVVDGARATVYNVGDSRICVVSRGKLRQISRDHTVAQDMLDMGIPPSGIPNSYHQLTQYLGIPESEFLLKAHQAELELSSNDRLLLCSDGLTDTLNEGDIAAILSNGSAPDEQARELTKVAERAGCKDNVTALVLSVDTAQIKK